MVLFDEFLDADKPGVSTHGEQVEMELKRHHAQLQVGRSEVTLDRSTELVAQGQPGALDGYLKSHFVDRVENADRAWENLVQSHSPRTLVHQSQGASESRAVAPLWSRVHKEPAFRATLEAQLGLPTSTEPEMSEGTEKRLLEALVARSDAIHRKDPEVQGAIQDLRASQAQAAGANHLHVISAGNEGNMARDMQRLGITIPSEFFRNELASPASIIVGAADDHSKEATSDNPAEVAFIASPYAGAMIAADGVDRPMSAEGQQWHSTGSSFAAPQVSSLSIDILEQQPNLSRDGLLTVLCSHATPLPGQEQFVGAGVVSYPS